MSEDGFFQAFVRLRSHSTGEWLVPPELRPKLVADAEAKGSNLTEVVLGILAAHYKVPFEPAGRKTKPSRNGEELNLRLPMRLYRAIAMSAARYPRTVQREILATLCTHYGLRLTKPPPRRRRRRGARAAA
jgi:hypothetical protein